MELDELERLSDQRRLELCWRRESGGSLHLGEDQSDQALLYNICVRGVRAARDFPLKLSTKVRQVLLAVTRDVHDG